MLNVFKSVCKQCNGTGVLEQYAHVLRGACYNCEGTGQLTWENVFVVESTFKVQKDGEVTLEKIEESFVTFAEAKQALLEQQSVSNSQRVSVKLHPARKIKRTGTLDVKGGESYVSCR